MVFILKLGSSNRMKCFVFLFRIGFQGSSVSLGIWFKDSTPVSEARDDGTNRTS